MLSPPMLPPASCNGFRSPLPLLLHNPSRLCPGIQRVLNPTSPD